jgi:acetoin:2,6-dichlorophenolindophenol oxidoreductase subunit alpha
LAEWKEQDPIARFTRELKRGKAIADEDAAAIESDARDLVERAAEFALASPWPAPDEVSSQVTA